MHPCVRDAKPPSFYVNAALVMLRKGNTGVFAFPLVPFQGLCLAVSFHFLTLKIVFVLFKNPRYRSFNSKMLFDFPMILRLY
ncbi:hypothetical protein V6N12_005587 [Hibiscus sabdariffa]|uniref:Transmembrane protein n=1 Tax=Hibiscus sabdariffa TaxID=183260 RepID=A0ABR2AQL3_9ROSI